MAKSRRYKFGQVTFDAESHTLWCGDEAQRLAPKASQVLEVLVEARVESGERPAGRESLMEKVWDNVHVEAKNLDVVISKLRKVLEECDPATPAEDAGPQQPAARPAQRHIEWVTGAGFKFVPAVERLPPVRLVIAVREPDKRKPDHYFDALGVVRPISNRLVHRRLNWIEELIVKPVDSARYKTWFEEKRELKADCVLNMETLKRGEIRQVSAQVLDEPSRSLKCSEEFERPEEELFDMLDEIVNWIVECLEQGSGQ